MTRPGAVVLVEEGLDVLDDIRVVGHKGPGSVQTLLLAIPETHQDGPLRVRVDLLQDPGGLHHDHGAGVVVGGSGTAVPGVEVGREDDVLVGLLRSPDLPDDVVGGGGSQILDSAFTRTTGPWPFSARRNMSP